MAYQLSYEFESLKHDVNTLFSRFYQKQSVRFEEFCAEWRAMNFNCIFAATYRNTFSAKMRLVERIFRVASEFLSEESTFLYRVATVYMFYAVYFKQISDHKVKIRMTPTMWKDLMDFLNIVIEHRHLDVAYVIQTLRKHKAFTFTAFPKYLLFGRHEFMLDSEGMVALRQSYEADKYVSGLFTSEFVQKTNSIQEEYDEVKAKVIKESQPDEVSYLSNVLYHSNSEFPADFKKILEGHQRVHEKGSLLKPDVLDTTQRPILSQLQELYHGIAEDGATSGTGTESDKPKKVKNVRGKMKEKAWKKSVETDRKKKSPKKRLADIEIEDEDDTPEKTVYYKRSAMLQEHRVRYPKKTRNLKGIRYRVGGPIEE